MKQVYRIGIFILFIGLIVLGLSFAVQDQVVVSGFFVNISAGLILGVIAFWLINIKWEQEKIDFLKEDFLQDLKLFFNMSVNFVLEYLDDAGYPGTDSTLERTFEDSYQRLKNFDIEKLDELSDFLPVENFLQIDDNLIEIEHELKDLLNLHQKIVEPILKSLLKQRRELQKAHNLLSLFKMALDSRPVIVGHLKPLALSGLKNYIISLEDLHKSISAW